jgi:hypothetical protein
MPSLKEYFDKDRYQAKYQFGDRVTGLYNGVRWIGSVGNDTVISEVEGPVLHIQLDLPLKVDGKYQNILVTKHKGVKKLVQF